MDENIREDIEEMIDGAIQNELSYETDYITNKGWKFLEEKAKSKVLEKIKEDDMDDDELEELDEEDIRIYLNDVINEYEEGHAPIRSRSLY